MTVMDITLHYLAPVGPRQLRAMYRVWEVYGTSKRRSTEKRRNVEREKESRHTFRARANGNRSSRSKGAVARISGVPTDEVPRIAEKVKEHIRQAITANQESKERSEKAS